MPSGAAWSVNQLRAQSKVHELVINLVIYAELSLMFEALEALDDAIQRMELRFQEAAARLAVPRRQGLCAFPPRRREQAECAGGFLYRCARRSAAIPDPDPLPAAVSVLFPNR